MSEKYNEEAEDLMFELFDEDDFTSTKMISQKSYHLWIYMDVILLIEMEGIY